EAERLFKDRQAGIAVQERDWAKVEIRAPLAGTVLEKNINVGDYVDTSTKLYDIADLTHLTVWANVYEEDLPALRALPPGQADWVCLRTELKPVETAQGVQVLQPGEKVVTGGALELASALKDIQGAAR